MRHIRVVWGRRLPIQDLETGETVEEYRTMTRTFLSVGAAAEYACALLPMLGAPPSCIDRRFYTLRADRPRVSWEDRTRDQSVTVEYFTPPGAEG